MEELVDIYNEEKAPTGKVVSRKDCFTEEGEYTFYVLAIIQDVQGHFLITQRAMDKKWAAGWWEVTGGGVRAGETPDEGLVREVHEEVGIDVSSAKIDMVYSYTNVDLPRGDNYHVNMYSVVLDFLIDDVVLEKDEAIACKLATWEDIEALNEQGIFLHYARVKTALGK